MGIMKDGNGSLELAEFYRVRGRETQVMCMMESYYNGHGMWGKKLHVSGVLSVGPCPPNKVMCAEFPI